MIVVGLTGSIAMGKSTVAAMFAELGVPTFNADGAVREFYAGGDAKSIEAAFPGVMVEGKIDRERLGARVLGDADALQQLESLVHPAVARARGQFLERAASEGRRMAIVDVPLRNQPVAKLGSIAHLEPGTPIGVLGYPIPDAFDDEHLGRTVSLYTGRVASVRKGALEIDVPIIPGESGGPVFDASSGDVIGIAESRFEEERAIGFATPIDAATRFLAAHPRTQAARR